MKTRGNVNQGPLRTGFRVPLQQRQEEPGWDPAGPPRGRGASGRGGAGPQGSGPPHAALPHGAAWPVPLGPLGSLALLGLLALLAADAAGARSPPPTQPHLTIPASPLSRDWGSRPAAPRASPHFVPLLRAEETPAARAPWACVLAPARRRRERAARSPPPPSPRPGRRGLAACGSSTAAPPSVPDPSLPVR